MQPNNARSKLILYQVEKYGKKLALKNGLPVEHIRIRRGNER